MTSRSQSPSLFAPGTLVSSRARQTGIARVLDLIARRRTRNRLAMLDDHILRDIGLTPEDAAAEIAKPFWRD